MAQRAQPNEVPPGKAATSLWAEYADGHWWKLDYVEDAVLDSVADPLNAGRAYASRNGLTFESRLGNEMQGKSNVPRYVFVRMTPKTTGSLAGSEA